MGLVYRLECENKDCSYGKKHYELFYAHGYRNEHNAKQEVLDGLYGEEIQKLVKEDKGTLNISEYLYVCDKCENIDVIPCLDYKIRVAKKFDETQEFANIDERYKAYREFINSMPVEVIEYKHYCKKCRNQLRKIEHPDKEELHCPSCHKVLRATSIGVS